MPETKKQSSPLAIVMIFANIAVLVSFFLPFASLFGRSVTTAFEIIEKSINRGRMPELLVLVALMSSVVGLIFAFVSIKKSKAAVGTIIMSVIGMILMFVVLSDATDGWISVTDIAGIGFYLYQVMNLLGIICAIMCVSTAKAAPAVTSGSAP